jgi:HEPN domain-containing protein
MNQQFHYRLKLAQGFLQELRQDISLKRWRSAMNNAQLAVENAAKSILALAGPLGRTHNPAPLVRQLLEKKLLPQLPTDKVARLAELAELLGPDVHIQTDYGDETGALTPWELFGEDDAQQALSWAEEAVAIVEAVADQLAKEGDA